MRGLRTYAGTSSSAGCCSTPPPGCRSRHSHRRRPEVRLQLPALVELDVVARGDAGMAQGGWAAQLAVVRRQNGALRAELRLLEPQEAAADATGAPERSAAEVDLYRSARRRRMAATAVMTTAAND